MKLEVGEIHNIKLHEKPRWITRDRVFTYGDDGWVYPASAAMANQKMHNPTSARIYVSIVQQVRNGD
jgi:hypothetical protein